MPRIRTLKPEHRQHRKIGPLSDRAYRLWVSMILEADDEGRLICDAAQLRVVTWGYHPRITEAQVDAEIESLAGTGMLDLYSVGGTRYAAFPSWLDHQRIEYPTPSKLPDPTGRVLIYPTEHAIQDELYAALSESRSFCGHDLVSVDRNVRIGSGYADIVVSTSSIRIVVELKKTRADSGALKQVSRYCHGLAGDSTGVLIAAGLGPKSSARDFASANIALITYDPDGNCTVAIPNRHIKECNDLKVKEVSVIAKQLDAISQQSRRYIASTPGSEGKGSEGMEGITDMSGNGNRRRADARDVLAFLNKKAERNYQPTTVNLGLIVARLNEGATVNHCRAIIGRKCAEWKGDPKMSQYLRPATLFNREKFAQYQGELPATAFENGDSHA